MTVARSSGFLIGTSTTAGDTIANNATDTGTEVDVLGNDTSEGWAHFFLYYTGTVAAGTIDVSIFYSQVTGKTAQDQSALIAQVVPINGSQKIYLGMFPVSRYMIGQIKNNAITASLTNAVLGYELYKES